VTDAENIGEYLRHHAGLLSSECLQHSQPATAAMSSTNASIVASAMWPPCSPCLLFMGVSRGMYPVP
jgi:hypothetical protein